MQGTRCLQLARWLVSLVLLALAPHAINEAMAPQLVIELCRVWFAVTLVATMLTLSVLTHAASLLSFACCLCEALQLRTPAVCLSSC